MRWHAHTTVATVIERDGRFLLVEEIDDGETVFNQPAGHLEEGESLFDAARRETLEESAWRVELEAFLGVYLYQARNGLTYVRHCFSARPLAEERGRPLDEGIIAAHWLSPEEILAPGFAARSPVVRQVVRDYLQGIRYPLSAVSHHHWQEDQAAL